ncbi:MAG: cyclic nucleotide-binding domain-containing protein [Treponema sp.]|nr:cyclic nucleotide-binding domain-containing protein [Treponema sp.]
MGGEVQLSFVSYKKDSYIVVEGKQDADRFFIIQQGKAIISREVALEEEQGKLLGPGDFFGVISTMSSHSHIETVKAATDVVLISVLQGQYGDLIQKNSQVAIKIIKQFSKRLRHLNEMLAGLTLRKTAEVDSPHLFNVAEYYFKHKLYKQAFYSYSRYLKYCPNEEHSKSAKSQLAGLKNHVGDFKYEYESNELNRIYDKNTMLFAEGEPGNELFIIQRGSVTITKIVDNKEVLLAVLKAGDILGEMALLEGKPRAASAVALEDCEVLAVNKVNFEHMIQSQPQLIAKITTLLADRIWLIYKQLANTFLINPLGRMYDALLIQLEKNRVPLNSTSPYIFSFGQWELINMVGLPEKEGNVLIGKMLTDKKILIKDKKIHAVSVSEIAKLAEYFRKKDKIEKTIQESRLRNAPLMT